MTKGPNRHHLKFCRALHAESAGKLLRWSTIARVAKRLGLEENAAIVLAGDCAAAGLVVLDVKGPPYRELPGSARLSEAGRRAVSASASTGSSARRRKPRSG